MKKSDLKKFKTVLEGRRQQLLNQATDLSNPVFSFKEEDLLDEVDLASSESDQNMNIRLRDRERILIRKVDKALAKIEDGDYGVCEGCGEEIGLRRLEARPVTDLCIRCKEEQERVERSFADKE